MPLVCKYLQNRSLANSLGLGIINLFISSSLGKIMGCGCLFIESSPTTPLSQHLKHL